MSFNHFWLLYNAPNGDYCSNVAGQQYSLTAGNPLSRNTPGIINN